MSACQWYSTPTAAIITHEGLKLFRPRCRVRHDPGLSHYASDQGGEERVAVQEGCGDAIERAVREPVKPADNRDIADGELCYPINDKKERVGLGGTLCQRIGRQSCGCFGYKRPIQKR